MILCEKGTGAAKPRLFVRAQRRSAEGTPFGVSADTRKQGYEFFICYVAFFVFVIMGIDKTQ